MDTIFELVDQGDANGIGALLAADPSTRELRSDEGLSPFMHAMYRGRCADPHIGEDRAYTVEAEAIARGNQELARLIEAAGASGDPNEATG